MNRSGAAEESDLQFVLRWAWVGLGVLAFVQFSWVATPVLFFHGGDNAHYLLLAEALAQGEGFSDVLLHPAGPHTKYPPIFPLLLAGIMAVFGTNIFAMKVMVALFGVVMVCATALLWQDRGGRGVALLATAWAATVPVTTTYAMLLLSEIPFAAFTVLTLLFSERALAPSSAARGPAGIDAWLASICMLLAALTRSAGVVLLPAVVIAALLAARRRDDLGAGIRLAGILGGPCALGLGLWGLRGRVVTGGEGHTYAKEFFVRDLRDADSGLIGVPDLLGRIGEGCTYYLEQLGRLLWSLPGGSGEGALWPGVALVALGGVGFVRAARAGWRSPELFTVFYVALIVVWHENEERFLVALFPTLLFYIVRGLQGLFAWPGSWAGEVGPRVARIVLGLVVLAFVGFNLAVNVQTFARAEYAKRELGLDIGPHFRIVAMNGGASRMLALAAHLREQAEPDARVLARKPRLVALASDRQTVGGPWESDPADFVRSLEREEVDYVVVDEIHPDTQRYVAAAIEAFPERFELIYQVDVSGSRLYRFAGRQ